MKRLLVFSILLMVAIATMGAGFRTGSKWGPELRPGFAPGSGLAPEPLVSPIQKYAKTGFISSGGKIYEMIDSISGQNATQAVETRQPTTYADGTARFYQSLISIPLPMIATNTGNFVASSDIVIMLRLKWYDNPPSQDGCSVIFGDMGGGVDYGYFNSSPLPPATRQRTQKIPSGYNNCIWEYAPKFRSDRFETVAFGWGANELRYYVNGEMHSIATAGTLVLSNSGPRIDVGGISSYIIESFNGFISDIVIFDRLLSKNQYLNWVKELDK